MSDSEVSKDFERKKTRRKEDEGSPEPDTFYQTGLLSLSDDVLLLIFSYLGPKDLLSLSNTCLRLYNVSSDKSLWEVVDIRPDALPLSSLKKFIKFLQSSTKFLGICGPVKTDQDEEIGQTEPSMTRNFLRAVSKNAPNLKTLVLDNHIIDTAKLMIEDFPSSLEHLSIRNCHMWNIPKERSYFYRLENNLPKLKQLDLSNNGWFIPHSLLALSKSTTLEHLTLTGCDVSACLPYASLAANFGFAALRCLDLRETQVSDTEVTCFNRTPTLRQLYLAAPRPGPHNPEEAQVTDCSITTFGGRLHLGGRGPFLNMGAADRVVIIEVGAYPRPACKLETLVVTHYPGVTDLTLRHVAEAMKSLRLLDVTGSGCSEDGLRLFKKTRPDVHLIPDPIH